MRVEIRGRDEANPGIRLLQPIGMALIAIAVVWWITFYTKAGGVGGAWECLVYSAAPCLDTITKSELAGAFAYRPFLMWIGLALWLAGIVLSPRRLRSPHWLGRRSASRCSGAFGSPWTRRSSCSNSSVKAQP